MDFLIKTAQAAQEQQGDDWGLVIMIFIIPLVLAVGGAIYHFMTKDKK